MKTKKTVVVVGSLNMDLVASTQRLPQRGETIFGKEFATFPGGKGANQAVAAGKLDAIVHMVGCTGRDGFGDELLSSLRSNHVTTDFIRQVDISTGTALITVADDGANTIVVVGGANMECSPIDVDQALEKFSDPGILLVQNEVPRETVEYAIEAAKKRGWIVIFNPAPARQIDNKLMAMVDVIMPNETEMAMLTNCTVDTLDEMVDSARDLLKSGVKNVIVTLGDKGAICCNESGYQQIKPYVVNAVDTTAAGDAYTGGLATALAEGKTLLESMDFAAAVAALSVTRKGAQPSLPWRTEVEEFMSKKEINK